MIKFPFWNIVAYTLLCIVLLQSCRDDSYLTEAPPVPNQSFVEEFDTATSAIARGWKYINVSEPKGSNIWQQGGAPNPWFSPYSSRGSFAGFIGADYTSTSSGTGIISNWVVSPLITMQNGDKISFYTRSFLYELSQAGFPGDSSDFVNRLQVRLNTKNESMNVGSGLNVGDFTVPVLDINPLYEEFLTIPSFYTPTAFPGTWTKFEATVVGLSQPTKGRFAFRYFLEEAGFDGRGSGVAIDRVAYTSLPK